ncbi:MAG: nuclease-related domain-containing protein [Proteobacteria bacterium]|nr:nuclease-related domain-containing protein [Pseudomonadota bacterium]MDA1064601.1 nuclease-related domain-containing protein [Pseudomonadota bacterium]
MTDFFPAEQGTWLIAAVALLSLLFSWWIYRRRQGGNHLQRVMDDIGYDRIDGLLIPKGDDGEIQIDHLLLTSRGLLIIDIKDVSGTVFGSDKMENWTVISDKHRFTFANPKPALYDRIAAVRQIVRQVPVEGRLVFLDEAAFTKGVPDLVASIDELYAEFHEADKAAAKFKIEAFKPHWDLIRKAALGSELSEISLRRNT